MSFFLSLRRSYDDYVGRRNPWGSSLLTPQGIAEKVALTSRFLKRKMEEYEALKVEIEALKGEVVEDEVYGFRKATK